MKIKNLFLMNGRLNTQIRTPIVPTIIFAMNRE